MKKAIWLDTKDNVAVVIEKVAKGETIYYTDKADKTMVQVKEDIQIYHKVAILNIKQGEKIYKYGECIAIACTDIVQGSLVHAHNVAGNALGE